VALVAILTLITVAMRAVVKGSIEFDYAFSGAMLEVPVALFLWSFGIFVRRADLPGSITYRFSRFRPSSELVALAAQQIFPDDRRQQRNYCDNRLDVLLH
jgi:hypothetical protein